MTPEHPQLTVRYTVEELGVIADLYDLDALPGCPRATLSSSTRGLATRCLIARNVLTLPAGGGVQIEQPHATLLATLLGAGEVIQLIHHRPGESTAEQWFVTDVLTVQVSELGGIVTMHLHDGRQTPVVGTDIERLPADAPVAAFDEVIHLTRAGNLTTVERQLALPVTG